MSSLYFVKPGSGETMKTKVASFSQLANKTWTQITTKTPCHLCFWVAVCTLNLFKIWLIIQWSSRY